MPTFYGVVWFRSVDRAANRDISVALFSVSRQPAESAADFDPGFSPSPDWFSL